MKKIGQCRMCYKHSAFFYQLVIKFILKKRKNKKEEKKLNLTVDHIYNKYTFVSK